MISEHVVSMVTVERQLPNIVSVSVSRDLHSLMGSHVNLLLGMDLVVMWNQQVHAVMEPVILLSAETV